ncbi:hypothetical protein K439DRAFT_1633060 [Ramaria rubella]|nr:hypothetical protein K439DRAFT_1633060 [Ramaria rubella]
MILEAANEIQTRWSVKIFPQSLDSEKTRRYRIERLARKDSLWFQCFVLHVALEQLPSAIAGDNSDWSLLSSLAVQVLAGLVHHLDSHTSVDEVAKDMVLASVEKAWLMGFDDTCPGTEEPV